MNSYSNRNTYLITERSQSSTTMVRRNQLKQYTEEIALRLKQLSQYSRVESNVNYKSDLIVEKCSLCHTRCDYSDVRKDYALKEAKRKTLLDLVDTLDNSNGKIEPFLNYDELNALFLMIDANLLRALKVSPIEASASLFDPEEEEPYVEPAWPELQIIYEMFRKIVVSPNIDSALLKQLMHKERILSILQIIHSEDPREREAVKLLLHKSYGKHTHLRHFIRKSIIHTLLQFVYDPEESNCVGISELLEILGSIINGFAVPLNPDHVDILVKCLMPLHSPQTVPVFHMQLSFCVLQFVEKEPKLVYDSVMGLLSRWPVSQSRKEVLFVNELEELIELSLDEELSRLIDPLFTRLAKCIRSSHFQVAERALFFWNNEYIVDMIVNFRERVLPLVYESLYLNSESHWNSNVQSLSTNVLKLVAEMDPETFRRCQILFVKKRQYLQQREIEIRKCWNQINKKLSNTNENEWQIHQDEHDRIQFAYSSEIQSNTEQEPFILPPIPFCGQIEIIESVLITQSTPPSPDQLSESAHGSIEHNLDQEVSSHHDSDRDHEQDENHSESSNSSRRMIFPLDDELSLPNHLLLGNQSREAMM